MTGPNFPRFVGSFVVLASGVVFLAGGDSLWQEKKEGAPPSKKLDLTFAKDAVPKDLKAGERVHVKLITAQAISGKGEIKRKTIQLVEGVEVAEVVRVEKPETVWHAVKVTFLADAKQAEQIVNIQSKKIEMKGKDGKVKAQPWPLLLERAEAAKKE